MTVSKDTHGKAQVRNRFIRRGRMRMTNSAYVRVLNFDEEQVASKCLEQHGTRMVNAPLTSARPGNHEDFFHAVR